MILPTAYLAPISWYKALLDSTDSELLIEACESYDKQTLRNRCVIAGANGTQRLTIPVCKTEQKQTTAQVRISYQTPWQHQHWQAIVSAYQNTPYFQYYQDFFHPIYETHFERLIDFNMALHQVVMQLLNRKADIAYTTHWHGEVSFPTDNNPKPYYQIFMHRHGFAADLSIIDLLFNMGPESILYL